ncbi:amidohydrolase family protein [Microbacterium sp.]|uniref:amidohydrolase n=1 Tax=Microbacterium sp. TaxID=51671 RepID=UPI0025FC5B5E|nr:amidohydrolase family protein [Microbacterium sp.]
MTLALGERVGVIANARLTGGDRLDPFGSDPVDLHLRGGLIADIAPAGALVRRGAVLDAAGGWVIPGLWDHHVHTVQWALSAQRADLGDTATAAEAASAMAGAPVLADGRRIGAGFRDALWPDAMERLALDAVTGEVPTYLINADVHSVWLNSAALRREGFEATASGVLREEPAFEISRRLNAADPFVSDVLVDAGLRAAAARGIVGVVDFDMAWNAEAWARRLGNGFDATRVSFGVYPELLDRAIAEGLQTGDAMDAEGLVRVGPLKVITDGSLGTRTAACAQAYPGEPRNHGVLTVPPDELISLLTRATGAGLACAVHAIGDLANTNALDAFAIAGAYGTIEHAQLVAHADLARFARLGVAASVQPAHAVDDRDLTDSIWATQTSVPYPLRSLADGGANLMFGSDAPVSPLDPWAAIAAAVFRTRAGRAPWRPEQGVDAATAVAASTAGGSQTGSALSPGDTADLAVIDRDPLTADEPSLRATRVAATLLASRLTHLA